MHRSARANIVVGGPSKRDSLIIVVEDRVIAGAIDRPVLLVECVCHNRGCVCWPGIVEPAGLIAAEGPERADTTSSHTVSIRAFMPLDPVDDLRDG